MGPGQASAEKDGETVVEKALVLYDALDDAFREAGIVRAMAPESISTTRDSNR